MFCNTPVVVVASALSTASDRVRGEAGELEKEVRKRVRFSREEEDERESEEDEGKQEEALDKEVKFLPFFESEDRVRSLQNPVNAAMPFSASSIAPIEGEGRFFRLDSELVEVEDELDNGDCDCDCDCEGEDEMDESGGIES